MTNQKEILNNLIEKLIAYGEDSDELHFWLEIFDDLKPEEQTALLENLKEELIGLEKLNKK